MGKKMLALRLRPSLVFFSPYFLQLAGKNDHLIRTIHKRQTEKQRQKHEAQAAPRKEKNTGTPALQGGGSPPFPLESNCLFSSLDVFLSLGLRLVCREAVFDEATGAVVTLPVRVPITRSVGEKC